VWRHHTATHTHTHGRQLLLLLLVMILVMVLLMLLVVLILMMLLLLVVLVIRHLVELHSWKVRRDLRMNRRHRHISMGLRSTLLLHVRKLLLLHLVHLRNGWRVLLQILNRQAIAERLLLLLLLLLILLLILR
jgi:hypothetical protein